MQSRVSTLGASSGRQVLGMTQGLQFRAVAQGLSAFWRPLSDSELEREVAQETASRGPAPKPDEAQARKSQTREPIQSKLAPILKEALQICKDP